MGKSKKRIIPFFILHQGCPFTCVFCNQRRISGENLVPNSTEIAAQIKNYLLTIPDGYRVEVAFYGGTFTGLPIRLQKELLFPAYQAYKNGSIEGIRISTRPDMVDLEGLQELRELGVKTVELGVQSLDARVLKYSKRGYRPEIVASAVNIVRKARMNLGLQMMIGLPRDTKESAIKTGRSLIDFKPDFVRIYPTLVIRGTALHRMFEQQVYFPLTLEKAIHWTKILYLMFKSHEIDVIRMGLHPSNELLRPGTVVAGPFHSAFGEMVEAAVALKQIETLLEKIDTSIKYTDKRVIDSTNFDQGNMLLLINPRYQSRVIGQKRSNLHRIKNKWNINLYIKVDASLALRDLILKTKNKEYLLSWKEFLNNYRIY